MATEQDIQELSERVKKLEAELASQKEKQNAPDWEAKMAEAIEKGDLTEAMQIYQDHIDRRASMSEAAHHVMEFKKRMGL